MRKGGDELFVGLDGILVRSSIGAVGVRKLIEFGVSGCTSLYLDPQLE